MPPFNILELLNDIDIQGKTKLVLDVRDPIPSKYSRLINHNINKLNFVINVSEALSSIFKKNHYSENTRFATICNSYIGNKNGIVSIDSNIKYILLIGTVYKEVANKLFSLIDESLKKINDNREDTLFLVVYSQIDPFLAKIKYSCYRYIKFNSFSYKPLDSIIQKCVCGIVPLWSGRYEGYGTKTFDFLSNNKRSIIIQKKVENSEFYQTFKADPNLLFINYNATELTSAIYDCLSNNFISSNYYIFDTELNSLKLYKILSS